MKQLHFLACSLKCSRGLGKAGSWKDKGRSVSNLHSFHFFVSLFWCSMMFTEDIEPKHTTRVKNGKWRREPPSKAGTLPSSALVLLARVPASFLQIGADTNLLVRGHRRKLGRPGMALWQREGRFGLLVSFGSIYAWPCATTIIESKWRGIVL